MQNIMTSMSATAATPPTSPGKRASQCKRKPPPSPAPTPFEFTDPRYPPFDLEDPFASLTELRRRSYSFNCNIDQRTLSAEPTDLAPLDLSHLSSKAFPSSLGRRYKLTVALPGSPYATLVDGVVSCRVDPAVETGDRYVAFEHLTKHSDKTNKSGLDDSRSIAGGHALASVGRDPDHHRLYSHNAAYLRDVPSTQTHDSSLPTKSHYIPRKPSSLSHIYTPPLTPDLSGSSSGNSSSSSSLFDTTVLSTLTPRMAAFSDKPLAMPRSPSPAANLVKRLVPRRSTGNLAPNLRRKLPANAKDMHVIPPPPTSPALRAERIADSVPFIPFPRASVLASVSDVSLPTLSLASSMTPSSARNSSPRAFRDTSPVEQEDQGYMTAPELLCAPGADLDAGLLSKRKNRLFSFSSRSLLCSRVDLYEVDASKKGHNQSWAQTMSYPFDEHALPTPDQLHMAASLHLVAESGVRIRFGDLWEHEKTVVIFIRHFRSSACQDYVRSIASEVDVEALEKAGLKIVIVGLGSPSLIAPYRQITSTRFLIYTDPTLAVHRALGMNLKTTDPGPESERGHYITGGCCSLGGLRKTFADAVARRLTLPLFERAGDFSQLGGEFVLGPGVACAFAHRMRTTRAHARILDVIAASGVQTAALRRTCRAVLQRAGREGRRTSMDDEEAWMAQRRRSLARLRRKRQTRRAGGAAAAMGMNRPGDALCEKKGRFPIAEEDEDEEEGLYAFALEVDPRRYDLRLEVHRQ